MGVYAEQMVALLLARVGRTRLGDYVKGERENTVVLAKSKHSKGFWFRDSSDFPKSVSDHWAFLLGFLGHHWKTGSTIAGSRCT